MKFERNANIRSFHFDLIYFFSKTFYLISSENSSRVRKIQERKDRARADRERRRQIFVQKVLQELQVRLPGILFQRGLDFAKSKNQSKNNDTTYLISPSIFLSIFLSFSFFFYLSIFIFLSLSFSTSLSLSLFLFLPLYLYLSLSFSTLYLYLSLSFSTLSSTPFFSLPCLSFSLCFQKLIGCLR